MEGEQWICGQECRASPFRSEFHVLRPAQESLVSLLSTKGQKLPRTSKSHPINVDFVTVPNRPSIKFGMTFCPGKVQLDALTGSWFRDLKIDLLRIRDVFNVQRLVCCLEQHELEMLKVESIDKHCLKAGLELFFIPIPDGGTPKKESLSKFQQVLPRLLESQAENGYTGIFCKGGLGRTGLITAALLREYGVNSKEAIQMVRLARPGAVENKAQESFVENYTSTNILEQLPSPNSYNPHEYYSGHTWGDEQDSLTYDQLVLKLGLNDAQEFLLPLHMGLSDVRLEFLKQKFATTFSIEKLYKQTDNLTQHLELPFPVKIGQYRKATHAICASLLKSRAESKGIAIFCPEDLPYEAEDEKQLDDRFLKMKDQLIQRGILLGEGRQFVLEEKSQRPDGNNILLAGPINEDDAIRLMHDLHQPFFISTGTLGLTKIVVSNA